MAMPGQQPTGGLGAMAPPKPQGAPQGQAPNPAQDAARISGMEQESPLTAEEVARKSLMDRRQQSEALEAQINLLSKSLDSRMNPGYDVPLMQMAAGFLKPTKTGSFGESLGYGMENYSKASDEEFARKQLVDKQRLEYMQKMADIQKQRGLLDYQLAEMGAPAQTTLRTGAESAPPGAPAMTPPAGGGMPSAPAPAAGAALTNAPLDPMVPQGSRKPMTIDRANLAGMVDKEEGERAWKKLEAERKQVELQLAQLKSSREGIIPTQFGMWDADKKEWVEKNPYFQKMEKADFGPFNPPGQDGRYATQKQIREYMALDPNDTVAMLKWAIANNFMAPSALQQYGGAQGVSPSGAAPSGGGARPAGGTAPSGGTAPAGGAKPAVDPFGRPTRIKTAQELEQEKIQNASQAEEAKIIAQGAGKAAVDLVDAGQRADDIKALAEESSSIAKAVAPAFKLLMNKDDQFRTTFDAYLQAAKTGVQAGQLGTFSIPTDIIERNNLNQREIQGLQKFAQIEAQFTLFNRRLWLKGDGAISNGESSVAAQLGPQLSDRPEVIMMKSQAIGRKADFDKSSAKAWDKWSEENPGKSFNKFLSQSPEFEAIKKDYLADLKAMRESNARYFAGEKPPTASAATPATPSTSRPAANETVLEKFKREQAARQGKQ
jgi:hypothetical protein